MIRQLLEKRANDYTETTLDILERIEENLVHAIRVFSKTGKDIRITSVYLFPTNPNFIVTVASLSATIGDKIKSPSGETIEITADNIKTVPTNNMHIILPAKVLDENDYMKIYEQIRYTESMLKEHGEVKFAKLLASGITDFDDLLNEENLELLEELTDPIDTILNSLDELQNVQYNLFKKNNNRTLH